MSELLIKSDLSLLNDRILNLGSGLATMPENGTMQVNKAFLTAILGYMEELLGMRRTQPTAPLTLEQLREMNGEPVWIQVLDRPDLSRWHFIVRHPRMGLIAKDGLGQYECYPHNAEQMVFSGCYFDIEKGHNYGKTWLAYRRPVEERE